MSTLLDQLEGAGPVDVARFDAEPTVELAVERILILLVDLAVAVNNHAAVALLDLAPTNYAESFSRAADAGLIDPELARSLRPSAGMRNVLVHDYLDVDRARVAAAVPLAIEQYRAYVRQVAAFLRDAAGDAT